MSPWQNYKRLISRTKLLWFKEEKKKPKTHLDGSYKTQYKTSKSNTVMVLHIIECISFSPLSRVVTQEGLRHKNLTFCFYKALCQLSICMWKQPIRSTNPCSWIQHSREKVYRVPSSKREKNVHTQYQHNYLSLAIYPVQTLKYQLNVKILILSSSPSCPHLLLCASFSLSFFVSPVG